MQLRVAQWVEDTEAEGPGRRFALWVQGCTLRCPGCCNPEMFAPDKGGALHDVDTLVEKVLSVPGIEGISILGGEPFEQAEGLAEFAARIREAGRSVMVFSGYTLGELHAMNSPHVERLLSAVDLLVDGRYEKDKPDTSRRWLGSTNQTVHFLSPRYSAADFRPPNTVELRFENGALTINGWPAAADAFRRR
jgi:anaerobic ribonucleoside-triphosphate reductase activating protein